MAEALRRLGALRLLALAAALSSPFWSLSHPLLELDDARYAQVPLEMLRSGDWATPTLAGMPYVEKPPLWYWLAALSYELFGVSERSARLPLAALSALCVGGTVWLGWWLFSPAAGVLAGALLSSCGLFFFLSHYATLDLPLSCFLLWASAFALRALLRPEDARWAAPAAWACSALAFLSKGLVGILFPALWLGALAVLYPRLWQPARAFLRPAGPLLFLAMTAPWLGLMESRHPGFLAFFFGEQHVERFLTPKYQRGQPVWFYLALLPAVLLPWAPAALAGLARAARRWRVEVPEAALGIWTLLVVLFFSMSQSKLATYILPVAGHMALLAARASERPQLWARRAALVAGGLFAAAALAAGVVLLSGASPTLPPLGFEPREAAGAATAVLALLSGSLLWWGTGRPLLAAAAAGWAIGLLGIGALSRHEDALSARSLGRYVAEIAEPGDELWAYGTYVHGLPFYSGRRVDRIVYWIGELHYAKRDPAHAERFADDLLLRSLPLRDRRVILVLRDFEARHVLTLFDAQKVVATRPVGRWVVIRI